VADWLVRRRSYRCQFYCHTIDGPVHWPPSTGRGLDVVQFDVGGVARARAVSWTQNLERGLCYACGCWEVLEARRPRRIDLILGRSAGLGSTLFAAAYAPRIPIVQFFDYYYHHHLHDLAAEPDRPDSPDYVQWRRTANAVQLLDLENGVHAWTVGTWQRESISILLDWMQVELSWLIPKVDRTTREKETTG
jgi:hypothetical protein